jgi:pentatricopeptide repeat protein
MRPRTEQPGLRFPSPLLIAPVLAFALALLVFALQSRSPERATVASGGFAGAGRTTDDRLRSLRAALERDPDARGFTSLGNTYLQKVRETADTSYYGPAERAFRRALARRPGDAGALAGLGALELSRHHFAAGLRLGRRAHAAAPDVVTIYGVIVDGLVELGRYEQAERALQRMIDLKPALSSYARVSYLRELQGDRAGATEAMRLAVSAGGDAAENLAYVQSLLGNLEFDAGKLARAERAYRLALSRYPGYGAAVAGLARVEAARGELDSAIGRLRALVARLPVPEHLVQLADAELAAGLRAPAAAHVAAAERQEANARRNGENTATESALLAANHGDPREAVVHGRRAWALSPSVRAADALGWALTRSGRPRVGLEYARRALRLGSRDRLFLYHAGVAARGAGRPALARRWLRAAVAGNPRFSPLYGPRAARALRPGDRG